MKHKKVFGVCASYLQRACKKKLINIAVELFIGETFSILIEEIAMNVKVCFFLMLVNSLNSPVKNIC